MANTNRRRHLTKIQKYLIRLKKEKGISRDPDADTYMNDNHIGERLTDGYEMLNEDDNGDIG